MSKRTEIILIGLLLGAALAVLKMALTQSWVHDWMAGTSR